MCACLRNATCVRSAEISYVPKVTLGVTGGKDNTIEVHSLIGLQSDPRFIFGMILRGLSRDLNMNLTWVSMHEGRVHYVLYSNNLQM